MVNVCLGNKLLGLVKITMLVTYMMNTHSDNRLFLRSAEVSTYPSRAPRLILLKSEKWRTGLKAHLSDIPLFLLRPAVPKMMFYL